MGLLPEGGWTCAFAGGVPMPGSRGDRVEIQASEPDLPTIVAAIEQDDVADLVRHPQEASFDALDSVERELVSEHLPPSLSHAHHDTLRPVEQACRGHPSSTDFSVVS